MPELPEVETVRQGLVQILSIQCTEPVVVSQIEVRTPKLRYPMPVRKLKDLYGQRLMAIERRAKYLAWHFDQHTLLNHLGMSGSWRVASHEPLRVHDHLVLHFRNHLSLIYHDPRRFGAVDVCDKSDWTTHKWIGGLGFEPLVLTARARQALILCAERRQIAIKQFLMDQHIIVGIGNIYVNEVLFLAGINPLRPAAELTYHEWRRLFSVIPKVLRAAMKCGGTTLKDFRQAGGSAGYFRPRLKIYGRDSLNCMQCGHTIEKLTQQQRSTYICRQCQT